MSIQGKTIVFTGKISKPRHEFQRLVEEHGGINGLDVTSSTDYLVVGEKPGSKLFRAVSQGTPTISESDFLKLLKDKPKEEEEEPDYCGTGPGCLRHHWFRTTTKPNGDIVKDCLCGTVLIQHPDGSWEKHEPRYIIEQSKRIVRKWASEQRRLETEMLRKKEDNKEKVIKQLEKLSKEEIEELERQLND